MGFYLTSGGAVMELDQPAEGTHARERFDDQVAKQELIPLDADQVDTVTVQVAANKDGSPINATRFVVKDGYHAPPPPGPTPEPESSPDDPGADEVPDGSVDDVLAWVGDDPDRARAALEVENAGKQRSTLIERLQAIAEG